MAQEPCADYALHRLVVVSEDTASPLPLTCSFQSISLSFFIARQRTVFEAGFALKTHGSLVKGLTPLRAFVAGLFFNFMLSMPATLKEPVFFTCSTATPMYASTTPRTSFVFKPVVSATDVTTPVW